MKRGVRCSDYKHQPGWYQRLWWSNSFTCIGLEFGGHSLSLPLYNPMIYRPLLTQQTTYMLSICSEIRSAASCRAWNTASVKKGMIGVTRSHFLAMNCHHFARLKQTTDCIIKMNICAGQMTHALLTSYVKFLYLLAMVIWLAVQRKLQLDVLVAVAGSMFW